MEQVRDDHLPYDPVVTDDEIIGTAKAIMGTYGDSARAEALSRAETMRDMGEDHSFELWIRIATIIGNLRI